MNTVQFDSLRSVRCLDTDLDSVTNVNDTTTYCMLKDTVTQAAPADTLPLYYKMEYPSLDSLFTSIKVTSHWGKDGLPIPYNIGNDNGVTGVLFLCFFVTCYVLTLGKHFFLQQIKSFFHSHNLDNVFTVETSSEFRYKWALVIQTCAMFGFGFLYYTQATNPDFVYHVPAVFSLGVYTLIFFLFFVCKGLLYQFVNWVFFRKDQRILWHESYFLIIALVGLCCFPVVLLSNYFNLNFSQSSLFFIFIVILSQILLIYKCYSIFFSEKHGFFYLIVYFCTLELMPCLFIWQVLILSNTLLIF
jgi:hypothetical protein